MRRAEPLKTCSCGMRYYALPADAKRFDDEAMGGHYFDCERCHSTNYVPFQVTPPSQAGLARTGTLLAFFTCLTLALLALYCARSAQLFSGLGERTGESAP